MPPAFPVTQRSRASTSSTVSLAPQPPSHRVAFLTPAFTVVFDFFNGGELYHYCESRIAASRWPRRRHVILRVPLLQCPKAAASQKTGRASTPLRSPRLWPTSMTATSSTETSSLKTSSSTRRGTVRGASNPRACTAAGPCRDVIIALRRLTCSPHHGLWAVQRGRSWGHNHVHLRDARVPRVRARGAPATPQHRSTCAPTLLLLLRADLRFCTSGPTESAWTGGPWGRCCSK